MTLKTTKLRDAIAFALVAGATAVAGTGVAFAQDQDEESTRQATTLDRIEVTGSRIKRADIEGALPVTVIDRVQLEASGDVNVADFLRNTNFNSFGSYQSSSGSSWGGFSGISLRGLGTGRTLILVDGRRAPTAPMVGNSQDLNSIPMAAVERIEILSDGASAIYGSDALGGVVNIITRKDFEGVEFTYGVGRPTEPGGDTEEMSLIIGSAGDRGRVLGGASYSKRDIIFTRDRDYWYSQPGASVYSNNFTTALSTAANRRLRHPDYGTAVPGLCTNGDDSDLFWFAPDSINDGGGSNIGSCQFNHSATSADLTSLENTSVFARGDYQINDDWLAFFNATVTRSESFGRYAPVPSSPWPGGAIHLPVGSPNHPSTPAADGGLNPHWDDPYYQTGQFPIAWDADGNATEYANVADSDLWLFHRFAALGNRDGRIENTVYNFMGGFEGRVGEVDLEFGARYVESRATDVGQNYVVGGLAQVQIDEGNYNIYDPFAGDPSALGFTATIYRDMKTTQKEFFGSAAFDLFDMAGGSSAMVLGAEFREEYYQDNYDPLSESGQIVGSAGNSASGGRDVWAAYTELLFPVLDNLELNFAGRYERYSDYGSDFAPKVSVRWQPLDTLTLRATYGEGFRAPPLNLLTQKTSFSAAATNDPATCQMLVGRPDCSTQVTTYSIANPNLTSEQSKQFGFGVVWDATDWLNVTVDYYDIEITDSIAGVGVSTVVGCLRGTTAICPSGISEFPQGTTVPNESLGLGAQFDPATGGIVNAQTGSANIGWIDTRGIDGTIRTNFDMGGWGTMRNMLAFSNVFEYRSNGGTNAVNYMGYPKYRASLSNSWNVNDFTFVWNLSYIHKTRADDPALNEANGFSPNVASWTIHDVQVSYDAPWNATITLGVNNVANKEPAFDQRLGGSSYDSYLYDPWGRVPYVRYTQRF